MTNADLEKIIASVDVAIRQAYALGRRDALDHVARWAQTEETTTPTPLALVAPAEPPAPTGMTETPRRTDDAPATPPRPRGFGALLMDYVYPSD
jgi:hypothetical protein